MAFLSNAGLERLWTKINDKLSTKVDKVDGKGLSTNDYTTVEKNKLSGIDTGANKTIVDSVLSTTSTNPVQNKVVNTAISNLNTLVGDKSVSSQISTAIASKADTGHTHTKSEVGLGNVDNTADTDKSVKYATSAGSAASVTGVVDFAHGGTGRPNRDSGYSNLMSGGVYKGSLNDAQNAGVYIFTTTNTTEYPTYAGRTDNWARLEVTTSARDSAEVMQRVIYSNEGVEFTRLHANGTMWTDWQIVVSGAVAHRQFVKFIPSGADLNDDLYLINGVYASTSSENIVANLPPFFGDGKGAFTLIVTGINPSGTYTNQILIALDNWHIYMRSQTNWQTPWNWTDWNPIIVERSTPGAEKSETHLNISQLSLEPNLYFDRNFDGYKYTRLYEAATPAAELAFAQKPVGKSEAISRLAWDGDHIEFRGDNNTMWLGSNAHPMARFYTSDYGTSLPAAGSKGRVFFKKV